MKNFTENTFWAKTKEDKLEKPGLFDELTKTFAAKSAPKKKEDGEGPEKKAAAKKKGKDLKVIDPKSAQNLCKCHKSLKVLDSVPFAFTVTASKEGVSAYWRVAVRA